MARKKMKMQELCIGDNFVLILCSIPQTMYSVQFSIESFYFELFKTERFRRFKYQKTLNTLAAALLTTTKSLSLP